MRFPLGEVGQATALILLETIPISKLLSPVRYPAPVKVLDWPGCRNVRDLGGLSTTDGGRTRYGALIRSDSHFRLTREGIAVVRAAGVSRILDLRWTRSST
jgi:hypothetical protein